MKLKKILCLNYNGDELEDNYWKELSVLGAKRVLVVEADAKNHIDADALLVKLGAKIDRKLIDNFSHLKYIGMLGTGYGGIDVKYAALKNITVTNISDNFSGIEIKGKTFGVIGLGHIGARTAELAQAFGAHVIYWSKNRKKEIEQKGIKFSDNLFSQANIITINLALNPETENFLNADRIASIKKGAIVINPSPMELLDFHALISRLKKGDITFMLDHSDEMTKEQLEALKPFDNCIIYPPIAYLTAEASKRKKRIYIDNLKNFIVGKPTNKVS